MLWSAGVWNVDCVKMFTWGHSMGQFLQGHSVAWQGLGEHATHDQQHSTVLPPSITGWCVYGSGNTSLKFRNGTFSSIEERGTLKFACIFIQLEKGKDSSVFHFLYCTKYTLNAFKASLKYICMDCFYKQLPCVHSFQLPQLQMFSDELLIHVSHQWRHFYG